MMTPHEFRCAAEEHHWSYRALSRVARDLLVCGRVEAARATEVDAEYHWHLYFDLNRKADLLENARSAA